MAKKKSNRGWLYGGIVVVIVAIVAGAHFLGTKKAANANQNKVTTIHVAGVAAGRPYTYAKGDKLGGYEGELFDKIDKALPQYKFKYSAVSQNSAFIGLQSGKYDVSASGYWTNKDRLKTYIQSDPDALADLRLVYRTNEPKITGFQDIVEKKLKLAPISSDDARYNIVEDYNKANPKEQIDLKAIGDQTAGDALKQIQDKQYDAVFYPYCAYYAVKIAGGAKGLTTSPSLGLKNCHFYYHKSIQNEKLNKAVNKELAKLKKDGTLEKLSKKWLGENVYKLPNAQKTWDDAKN